MTPRIKASNTGQRFVPSTLRWPYLRSLFVFQGAVLLLAGFAKSHELMTIPVPMLSMCLALVLVAFELAFGAWLVLGNPRARSWKLAVVLFSTLAAVSLWKVIAASDSCGCFGRLHVKPWITLAIDVTMVGLLAICRAGSREVSSNVVFHSAIAQSTVFTILLICIMSVDRQLGLQRMRDGEALVGRLMVLEPDLWVHQRFALIRQMNILADLTDGDWDVLLFREGCNVCHDVMKQLATTQEGQLKQIALISVDGDRSAPLVSQLESLGCVVGELSPDTEWFVTTPVRVSLTNGICVRAQVIHRWDEWPTLSL